MNVCSVQSNDLGFRRADPLSAARRVPRLYKGPRLNLADIFIATRVCWAPGVVQTAHRFGSKSRGLLRESFFGSRAIKCAGASERGRAQLRMIIVPTIAAACGFAGQQSSIGCGQGPR
jgi:hypothetical protein